MSNTLTQLSIQLIRIISPLNILLGVVGNSINIIVLTRPTLQNYASTHYFLALVINNLFVSSFILVTDLLADGYQIDISTFSLISCKISRYLSSLCAVLSAYFIVLALIDRYYTSSLNANRRKLSNVKTARCTPTLSDIISGHNFRKELFTFINRILTHLAAAALKHSYEMRIIKQ